MRSVNRERMKARGPTAAQLGAQVVDGNHQNIPLLRLGLLFQGFSCGLRLRAGLGTEDTLVMLLLLRARPSGHRHRRSQERQGHERREALHEQNVA